MPRIIYLLIITILLSALIYQYLSYNSTTVINITPPKVSLTPTLTVTPTVPLGKPAGEVGSPTPPPKYYTGVQLWAEIQKYRVEHGLPEFRQDNTLCTIASIRVNQLLDAGKLDDHNGFPPLVEKYRESGQLTHHNVAENILSGFATASEAVAGWDSSLGHRALMQDGSFVYGCASANYGFAVLIAAY